MALTWQQLIVSSVLWSATEKKQLMLEYIAQDRHLQRGATCCKSGDLDASPAGCQCGRNQRDNHSFYMHRRHARQAAPWHTAAALGINFELLRTLHLRERAPMIDPDWGAQNKSPELYSSTYATPLHAICIIFELHYYLNIELSRNVCGWEASTLQSELQPSLKSTRLGSFYLPRLSKWY